MDRIEREASPQATHLLYKIIALRNQKHSTALVTNIDFDKWGDYLPGGPTPRPFLDRLVEGVIILKIQGKPIARTAPRKEKIQSRERRRFLILPARLRRHLRLAYSELDVTEHNHTTGPPLTAKVDLFFAATDTLEARRELRSTVGRFDAGGSLK